jgi:UPF0755 protein
MYYIDKKNREKLCASLTKQKDDIVKPERVNFVKGVFALCIVIMVFSSASLSNDMGILAVSFEAVVSDRAEELGMTYEQLLVLASIIQLEGTNFNDKRKVSAVFHNRLKRNMKLQSCATVNYVRQQMGEKFKLHLSDENVRIDNPYNTYKYFGLPPKQLCKPNLSSVYAAMYPDSDEKLLFFRVHSSGKYNLFSRSWNNHQKLNKIYGSA